MLKKLAVLGVFLWGTFVFADVNMHEGLWEITTKTEMQGMPVQMPPIKHTECLTKKNMLKSLVTGEQGKQEACKITNTKISGNTVTWVMKCGDKNAMEVTGKTTYRGDTFEGTLIMISDSPQEGKFEITNHISGKRIGECR